MDQDGDRGPAPTGLFRDEVGASRIGEHRGGATPDRLLGVSRTVDPQTG